MMVGDNVYHYDVASHKWHQADSHHSNADGSINPHNLGTDTKSDKVLISRHFFYFGVSAPMVPDNIMNAIGFKNGIGHRVYERQKCVSLLDWLDAEFASALNTVQCDPYYLEISNRRYSVADNKIF
jgi:hypothetical protein